jgi:branched-chain amino acid transport system ATP-binding protein
MLRVEGLLHVEGIDVQYGRIRALREVSLTVAEGEVVTIIGANGAGKTSLLNAVFGAVPVGAGKVRFGGQSIVGLPAHRVARLGIGYVPEGRQVFGSMSVLDNLLLGAYVHTDGKWSRLLGLVGSFQRDKMVLVGLERAFALFPILYERRSQQAGSLSGGEQQMLAIARALMASPRLLLLDEPSVGLAPLVVREILQLLGRLRNDGLTILLVEQDAVAALKVADRGYAMERGRMVVDGPARDLLANERVRHAYLGRVRTSLDE